MNKKYQPQIVPRKQNTNLVLMSLALCMRRQCKLCVQIVRDVQWSKKHWQLVLQPVRLQEVWEHMDVCPYCLSLALFDQRPLCHPVALPSAAPLGTEQQWDGCTAPQEHSIHLQAGVGCNSTVTLTEYCCFPSKFHVLLEGKDTEHKCCPYGMSKQSDSHWLAQTVLRVPPG